MKKTLIRTYKEYRPDCLYKDNSLAFTQYDVDACDKCPWSVYCDYALDCFLRGDKKLKHPMKWALAEDKKAIKVGSKIVYERKAFGHTFTEEGIVKEVACRMGLSDENLAADDYLLTEDEEEVNYENIVSYE